MNAYLIDANQKTVTAVDLVDGLAGIRRLIGCHSVDSEEVGTRGDRLFFDENCFLRDQTGQGRFKLDRLVPVAGRAVIVGAGEDGTPLKDAAVELEALRERIAWL
ncbi:MAG: hypothetical protein ACYCY9_05620 [Thiobacillus sp.]